MSDKRLETLLNSMAPLSQVKPYSRTLIYGESGVGKTVLACDFGDNPLLVDSSDGWVSLLNHRDIAEKVTRVSYEGIPQLETICAALENGDLVNDVLILDELSSMSVSDLDMVLKSRSMKDPNKDPNIPTQPDFFANTERMRRIITRIFRLPTNIVVVAHVREDKDETTGIVITRPAFSPKLRKTISEKCHLIGYLTTNEIQAKGEETKEYTRKMQVRPTRRIDAKTRIGELPTVIQNPDLNKIYKSWQGTLSNDTQLELPQEPDAVTSAF